MELFLECLPCLVRQTLEAARMATADETVQAAIMDDAMQIVTRYRDHCCAAREAHDVGMDAHATIVSTGCVAPGAILDRCSQEFRTMFDQADVIISKGQGNFEALSGAERRISFLLEAKCPRLADALGVDVGHYALKLGTQLA